MKKKRSLILLNGGKVKYLNILKIKNIFKNSLWMVGVFHGQTELTFHQKRSVKKAKDYKKLCL